MRQMRLNYEGKEVEIILYVRQRQNLEAARELMESIARLPCVCQETAGKAAEAIKAVLEATTKADA